MRRTILLADDSPTIQRLVAQTFADAVFNIVPVSNGELAIRKLDEVRPDLILADVYMPGKSGYEVCAFVRAHPTLAATPVVLLVGAFDAFDEETALQAGASASITKPFEAQALVDLAVSLLNKGNARDVEEDNTVAEDRTVALAPHAMTAVPAVPTAAPAEPSMKPARVEPARASAAEPVESVPHPEESDLLGLEALFKDDPPHPAVELSDADIERIADRVLQKLSVQAIESVAWDIVPDIVDKILRDAPKRV